MFQLYVNQGVLSSEHMESILSEKTVKPDDTDGVDSSRICYICEQHCQSVELLYKHLETHKGQEKVMTQQGVTTNTVQPQGTVTSKHTTPTEPRTENTTAKSQGTVTSKHTIPTEPGTENTTAKSQGTVTSKQTTKTERRITNTKKSPGKHNNKKRKISHRKSGKKSKSDSSMFDDRYRDLSSDSEGEEIYSCFQCEMKCDSVGSLRTHLHTHVRQGTLTKDDVDEIIQQGLYKENTQLQAGSSSERESESGDEPTHHPTSHGKLTIVEHSDAEAELTQAVDNEDSKRTIKNELSDVCPKPELSQDSDVPEVGESGKDVGDGLFILCFECDAPFKSDKELKEHYHQCHMESGESGPATENQAEQAGDVGISNQPVDEDEAEQSMEATVGNRDVEQDGTVEEGEEDVDEPHGEEEEDEGHTCSLCGKVFRNQDLLITHLTSHIEVKKELLEGLKREKKPVSPSSPQYTNQSPPEDSTVEPEEDSTGMDSQICALCAKACRSMELYRKHLDIHVMEGHLLVDNIELVLSGFSDDTCTDVHSKWPVRGRVQRKGSAKVKTGEDKTLTKKVESPEKKVKIGSRQSCIKQQPEASNLTQLTPQLETCTSQQSTKANINPGSPYSSQQPVDNLFQSSPQKSRRSPKSVAVAMDRSHNICHFCGKGFSFTNILLNHLRVMHKKTITDNVGVENEVEPVVVAELVQYHRPQPHVCEWCQKAFSDKKVLIIHRRQHTQARPHCCYKCSQIFLTKTSLEFHMRQHTRQEEAQVELGLIDMEMRKSLVIQQELVTELDKENSHNKPALMKQFLGPRSRKQAWIAKQLRLEQSQQLNGTESKEQSPHNGAVSRQSSIVMESPASPDLVSPASPEDQVESSNDTSDVQVAFQKPRQIPLEKSPQQQLKKPVKRCGICGKIFYRIRELGLHVKDCKRASEEKHSGIQKSVSSNTVAVDSFTAIPKVGNVPVETAGNVSADTSEVGLTDVEERQIQINSEHKGAVAEYLTSQTDEDIPKQRENPKTEAGNNKSGAQKKAGVKKWGSEEQVVETSDEELDQRSQGHQMSVNIKPDSKQKSKQKKPLLKSSEEDSEEQSSGLSSSEEEIVTKPKKVQPRCNRQPSTRTHYESDEDFVVSFDDDDLNSSSCVDSTDIEQAKANRKRRKPMMSESESANSFVASDDDYHDSAYDMETQEAHISKEKLKKRVQRQQSSSSVNSFKSKCSKVKPKRRLSRQKSTDKSKTISPISKGKHKRCKPLESSQTEEDEPNETVASPKSHKMSGPAKIANVNRNSFLSCLDGNVFDDSASEPELTQSENNDVSSIDVAEMKRIDTVKTVALERIRQLPHYPSADLSNVMSALQNINTSSPGKVEKATIGSTANANNISVEMHLKITCNTPTTAAQTEVVGSQTCEMKMQADVAMSQTHQAKDRFVDREVMPKEGRKEDKKHEHRKVDRENDHETKRKGNDERNREHKPAKNRDGKGSNSSGTKATYRIPKVGSKNKQDTKSDQKPLHQVKSEVGTSEQKIKEKPKDVQQRDDIVKADTIENVVGDVCSGHGSRKHKSTTDKHKEHVSNNKEKRHHQPIKRKQHLISDSLPHKRQKGVSDVSKEEKSQHKSSSDHKEKNAKKDKFKHSDCGIREAPVRKQSGEKSRHKKENTVHSKSKNPPSSSKPKVTFLKSSVEVDSQTGSGQSKIRHSTSVSEVALSRRDSVKAEQNVPKRKRKHSRGEVEAGSVHQGSCDKKGGGRTFEDALNCPYDAMKICKRQFSNRNSTTSSTSTESGIEEAETRVSRSLFPDKKLKHASNDTQSDDTIKESVMKKPGISAMAQRHSSTKSDITSLERKVSMMSPLRIRRESGSSLSDVLSPERSRRESGEVRVKGERTSSQLDSAYKCKHCNRNYDTLLGLRHHRKSKTKGKEYKCCLCYNEFARPVDLKEHDQLHQVVPPFECPTCDKKFSSRVDLFIHFKQHLGLDDQYPCVECTEDIIFPNKMTLRDHVHDVHPSEYVCDACANKFRVLEQYYTHLKDKHPQLFQQRLAEHEHRHKCHICHSHFVNLDNFKRHMKVEHQISFYPFFPCPICQKVYETEARCDLHKKSVHSEDKVYHCTHARCDFMCTDKAEFDRHRRSHTGDKPYKCSICSKAFSNSQELTHHHSTVHPKISYKCSLCSKAFSTSQELTHHHSTVHSKVSYKCELCPMSFKSKNSLHEHVITKHPFPCDLCNFQGSTKAHLKKHVETRHVLSRITKCKYCGLETRQMDKHVKVHTRAGQQKIKCDSCNLEFYGTDNLERHRKAQHKEHKCDLCDRVFQIHSHLILHRNEGHKSQLTHKCTQCDKLFDTNGKLQMHMKEHKTRRQYKCPHCTYKNFSKLRIIDHISQTHT